MRLGTFPVTAVGALLLAACSGGVAPRQTPPPAAFQPEAFPDLPMPPGYIPQPGGDHLAVVLGGGAIRRYHTVLRQVADEDADLDELGDWYRRRLTRAGWTLADDAWPQRQDWRKRRSAAPRAERLVLETGRADGRTIIRLAVAPTPD